MRCFIEEINNDSVCVCGEFDKDVKKDPCYQSLQGQSGGDFSKNLANEILQKNALLSLLVAVAVVGLATQANAQKFEDEVEKVNVMSDTIAGIVASMRVFRHIVLANV